MGLIVIKFGLGFNLMAAAFINSGKGVVCTQFLQPLSSGVACKCMYIYKSETFIQYNKKKCGLIYP